MSQSIKKVIKKEMLSLPLNSVMDAGVCNLDVGISIQRVPGGWNYIYSCYNSEGVTLATTFVPEPKSWEGMKE